MNIASVRVDIASVCEVLRKSHKNDRVDAEAICEVWHGHLPSYLGRGNYYSLKFP